VVQLVREVYLRDDLPCGADSCQQCSYDHTPMNGPRLISHPSQLVQGFPNSHYVIIDSTVALQQV
jgi:hypothetical protein